MYENLVKKIVFNSKNVLFNLLIYCIYAWVYQMNFVLIIIVAHAACRICIR